MTENIAGEQRPAAPRARKSIPLVVKMLVGLFLIVGAFAAYIANQPDDFRVERSITIVASPEQVFDHVDDFASWEAWSPWAKLDPNAKNTFEGPESGEGAKFSWSGNDQVGAGSMTITACQPSEHLRIELAFTRPMQDTSIVEFHLTPEGEQTKVSWSMAGRHQNLIGKAICFFMNMERMIGDKYEEGLANLKNVVEVK